MMALTSSSELIAAPAAEGAGAVEAVGQPQAVVECAIGVLRAVECNQDALHHGDRPSVCRLYRLALEFARRDLPSDGPCKRRVLPSQANG